MIKVYRFLSKKYSLSIKFWNHFEWKYANVLKEAVMIDMFFVIRMLR